MRGLRRVICVAIGATLALVPAACADARPRFQKVSLSTASGKTFTSVVLGPEGKLYAGTIDGEIVRWPLSAGGTTGVAEVITSLKSANGGARLLIGLAFDPMSTPAAPILWVTHSHFSFANAPDWTGKISRLSGSALGTVQDYVVGLPRSTKEHLTNSLAFGPDGALYVLEGSNTTMGAPDSYWNFRAERLLTAAVLRVDTGAIVAPPLAVKTEGGGSYDPFMPGAPLTIYASGLRNAYDLVWHSNGSLYVPTNGSRAGGNAPGTPRPLPPACSRRLDGAYRGPPVPALKNVRTAQPDFLFRVVQRGYYGHPNPRRCEWVLNGGNPSSSEDTVEVPQYRAGTLPDRNWRGAAFDFGLHRSADGVVEYTNGAFGGELQGKLLVTRYAADDDVIALSLDVDGNASEVAISGLTGFSDPLDIAEDPSNGNLYVTEFGANRITLLRPQAR